MELRDLRRRATCFADCARACPPPPLRIFVRPQQRTTGSRAAMRSGRQGPPIPVCVLAPSLLEMMMIRALKEPAAAAAMWTTRAGPRPSAGARPWKFLEGRLARGLFSIGTNAGCACWMFLGLLLVFVVLLPGVMTAPGVRSFPDLAMALDALMMMFAAFLLLPDHLLFPMKSSIVVGSALVNANASLSAARVPTTAVRLRLTLSLAASPAALRWAPLGLGGWPPRSPSSAGTVAGASP